jgi:hypothetical protein
MDYDNPLPDAISADSLMCLCAFRYAIGRMTYVPSHVVRFLKANWPKIDSVSRDCITRDLRDEIHRDDMSRERDCNAWHPLGHDCDRNMWVEFNRWIEDHGGD